MSIYSKPLSQIETADLDELLKEGAVENARLEFKSEIPKKDEMLKKISSFANSFGGFLVVGAKADSATGRIDALPGVREESGYKQKVVQWCFDGASPPLIVEVSDPIPMTAENGRFCYVTHVAESDVAPHFLNGRNGVWVRSDEFSQRYKPELAEENELRYLFDRRRLVQQRREDLILRSERRFERTLARRQEGLNVTTRSKAALSFCIGPRFPSTPVCPQAQLAKEFHHCRIAWRQTSFPSIGASSVSQHESALFVSATDDYKMGMVEANIWGMLFYGTEIEVELNPETSLDPWRAKNGIFLVDLVGLLLVFTEHAKNLAYVSTIEASSQSISN